MCDYKGTADRCMTLCQRFLSFVLVPSMSLCARITDRNIPFSELNNFQLLNQSNLFDKELLVN